MRPLSSTGKRQRGTVTASSLTTAPSTSIALVSSIKNSPNRPTMPPEGHDENNSKLQNKTSLETSPARTSRTAAHKVHSHSHSISSVGWASEHQSGLTFINPVLAATNGSSSQLDKNGYTPPSRSSEAPLEPINTPQMKRDKGLHVVSPKKSEAQSSSSSTPSRKHDQNSSLEKECKEDEFGSLRNRCSTETPDSDDGVFSDKCSTKSTAELGRISNAIPPRPTTANTRQTDGADNTKSTPRIQEMSTGSSRPPAGMASRRSASPNKIPRVHKDTRSAPFHQDKDSVHSHASSQHTPKKSWNRSHRIPEDHEQLLFEQRLCADPYGVAVRKINQYGKSNLRYVRCMYLDPSEVDDVPGASTKSSVSSLAWNLSKRRHIAGRSGNSVDYHKDHSQRSNGEPGEGRIQYLTWGKKKDVKLPLTRFVCVRKGKTTERARRSPSPSCRILSLITDDPNHLSLDIEAPTQLDRDKFSRAFSRFLRVPMEGDLNDTNSVDVTTNAKGATVIHQGPASNTAHGRRPSSANSAPDLQTGPKKISSTKWKVNSTAPLPVVMAAGSLIAKQQSGKQAKDTSERDTACKSQSVSEQQMPHSISQTSTSGVKAPFSVRDSEYDSIQHNKANFDDQDEIDDGTHVSSLTGAGFDVEIVEELHQALNDLRAELEESRAEAARAVKVAEQAIQSAENSNSRDWNSTVTHKAAEAAAMAQKRSAEAMAKQRLAEERLEAERRNAAFWRRQAEAAEEEAGSLQTRAAAAEVQRELMAEELESERRKALVMVDCLKNRFSSSEVHQREALESAMERNRALELELDGTRRDLTVKNDEVKILQENFSEFCSSTNESHKNGTRKNPFKKGRKKRGSDDKDTAASRMLLSGNKSHSSSALSHVEIRDSPSGGLEDVSTDAERILKIHAEATVVRKQFELLKKATIEELRALPSYARNWVNQASQAIDDTHTEVEFLREKLAIESATRRKLLHQVQDLRGVVRVYCRPRSSVQESQSIISIPSQEAVLLHERAGAENSSPVTSSLSFKFDRVFEPNTTQKEIYNEIEEVCLGVLDGYNICILSYGQTGSGKTYSLLGDVRYSCKDSTSRYSQVEIRDYGIHLETVRHLFSIVEHRSDRYQDTFALTIVEVHNERLCDLVAGTEIAESRGRVVTEDTDTCRRKTRNKRGGLSNEGSPSQGSRQGSNKLEIRTNHNGDTVVQGVVSVEVKSFVDVCTIWEQCLTQRACRLTDQGINMAEYESSSHVIATLNVTTMNVSTGIGSVGRIQFADLAGADLVPRRASDTGKKLLSSKEILASTGGNTEWKFANKSLSTLSDVVNCRSQFMHNVPYRNSTLTHLLRDNLEADAKVLCLVCINSDRKDLQETASALRFAARIRSVNIGKATKHTVSRP